ncbi:MAG: tryptophan synthase subunit beta [Nocardioides sp.]|nr:tryptophan synthase subunit beta [Nocardioides sp.]
MAPDALDAFDADERGWFGGPQGGFGGRFVPEALMRSLDELDEAWQQARAQPGLLAELDTIVRGYGHLPSPLDTAARLSRQLGVRVLLKREDLNHTGSHHIRSALGQALLTVRLGKRRVVAETGTGQHGVAVAAAAAYFGLDCTVYMGSVDVARQSANVVRMRLLGATVVEVASGSGKINDATNEAVRDLVTTVDDTAYIPGAAMGPHPLPSLVRDLVKGIGEETRGQAYELTGRLPSAAVAAVGGGSDAIGLFSGFLADAAVELHGVEGAGQGLAGKQHAAVTRAATSGVLHGARTLVLQDEDGQTCPTHSIAAGLDRPAIGPQHAWLARTGRVSYAAVTDAEAMEALSMLARAEGIICSLESAHAVAGAVRIAPRIKEAYGPDASIVVSLGAGGGKDLDTAASWLGPMP